MPLRLASGHVAGLACGLILTFVTPAGADPGQPAGKPAGKIADAREQVRTRAEELGRAQADLAAAKARLGELNADVERLVEAYNGQLVMLRSAEEAYKQVSDRVAQARAEVEEARKPVAAVAAQRYANLSIGEMGLAMVTGPQGFEGFMQQASVLSQLGDEQAASMQNLTDTQTVLKIVQTQAERAYTEQAENAERARLAKEAAAEAVTEQQQQTAEMERATEEISRRLDAARSRVEQLRQARQARRQAQLRAIATRAALKAPAWASTEVEGPGGVAVNWALQQLGKPYVWAAAGPSSFDCSGLTMRAWERAGVDLDHWTGTQWQSGPHVPVEQLQPGDLVFFGRVTRDPGSIHHVGLYIGRGLMVHAPQTGDVVRIAPIWRPDLVGATRPT
ncbi:NlpC/P60 family protein [Microtetraspora sp. NBRC 16547]|uniref:C40 family peptidase n=1 Tax=Microtetraspora sp. NBRC 16547 TaxID=3030993 RepID=UPI0024A0E187|nr:NlpC/P60 family protein [Microtetraspora sp. NBRC 16547]GLX00677.1 glycoside hydrolase [Microtetraspora sp. NBRC 16547]